MVYENLSRQVQVLVRERMRIVKQPTQSEISAEEQYAKVLELLSDGYSQEEIRIYIDSVYYK